MGPWDVGTQARHRQSTWSQQTHPREEPRHTATHTRRTGPVQTVLAANTGRWGAVPVATLQGRPPLRPQGYRGGAALGAPASGQGGHTAPCSQHRQTWSVTPYMLRKETQKTTT